MAGRETDKMRGQALDGLLRHTLREGESSPDPCPNPEILAAYFERSLDDREMAQYELHLSRCAHCRQQLAAIGLGEELPRNAEREKPRWAWLWDWRWLAPATAVLALAALWYARTETIREKPVQLAYLKSSDSAEAPPVRTAPPSSENGASPGTRDVRGEAEHLRSRVAPVQPEAPAAKEDPADRKAENERSSNLPIDADKADKKDSTVGGTAVAPVPGAESSAAAAPAPAAPSAEISTASNVVGGGAGTGAVNEPPATAKIQPHGPLVASRNAILAYEARSSEALIRTPNPRVLWRIGPVGPSGGTVEQSIDGGATWTAQLPGTRAQLTAGSAPAEKTCWFVGREGMILLTTNGADWKRISPPAPVDFAGIVAKDARNATVTAADGRKFTTSDGGESWTSEPSVPSAP